MSKYEARLQKLENQGSNKLKVFACPTPGMHITTDSVVSEIARCAAFECACRVEYGAHMRATGGRGTMVVLDYEAVRL